MAVIKSDSNDRQLLARLLRAEAEAEGEQGILMGGNVGVNRSFSVWHLWLRLIGSPPTSLFETTFIMKKAFLLKARGGNYHYVE